MCLTVLLPYAHLDFNRNLTVIRCKTIRDHKTHFQTIIRPQTVIRPNKGCKQFDLFLMSFDDGRFESRSSSVRPPRTSLGGVRRIWEAAALPFQLP